MILWTMAQNWNIVIGQNLVRCRLQTQPSELELEYIHICVWSLFSLGVLECLNVWMFECLTMCVLLVFVLLTRMTETNKQKVCRRHAIFKSKESSTKAISEVRLFYQTTSSFQFSSQFSIECIISLNEWWIKFFSFLEYIFPLNE